MPTSEYQRPSHFVLNKLILRSLSNGNARDLTNGNVVSSFTIKESINENCTTATFNILESYDLPQYFPIIGEEEIELSFSTDSTTREVEYIFRVYNIVEKKQTSNNMMSYTLNCVTPEFLNSMSNKISRSYKDMTIDNIVADISDNELTVNKSVSIVSRTVNVENITFPFMSPLQCINWCCSIAHPTNNRSATYKFFEDRESFKFASVEDLIQQEPYKSPRKFSAKIQNTENDGGDEGMWKGSMSISNYKFIRPAPDVIKQTMEGTRSSKTISFDPLTKTSRTFDFDYEKEFDNMVHADNEKVQVKGNEFISPYSKYNILFTKTHRRESGYITSKGSNDYSYEMEESVPWRASTMGMYETIQASISIPGDSNLSCGMTILCDFPNSTIVENHKDEVKNKLLSGKYLINSVVHNVVPNAKEYTQTLDISKDTFGDLPKYDL